MDIIEQTRLLLRETKEPMAAIARECGVTPRYLYRLAAGEYADPGYKVITRIHAYLTRQQAA